jgi:hypothetical protein
VIRTGALTYLGDCGTKEDLPVIREELDKGTYKTTGAAIDAIL